MSVSTPKPARASTPRSTVDRRLLRGGHGADRRPVEGPARRRRDRPTPTPAAIELIAESAVPSSACESPRRQRSSRPRPRGVVLGHRWVRVGPQSWSRRILRGPMHGPVSPPNNTGDGLRMAMAHGADLANMGEAWWVPIMQIPGDTFGGQPRSRSVRLERTRPRSIIVNRAGKRFLNEAGEYNSMAGPFHHLDPRYGYLNDPAWIVFDSQHLKRYGFLGVEPDGAVPDWFCESGTLPSWARRRASTPRPGPHARRRGTRTSPTNTIPTSAVAQALTTGTGATTTAATTGGQDARADRHRALLRGAGDGGRDGHQGRPAHRPRRPRAARQRRTHPRALRRGQRDGRCDRQGVRWCRRNNRPRNGIRLPGGGRRGDGLVSF